MEIKMSGTKWRTVGFTAAPAGWRVFFRSTEYDDDWCVPLAGWLRQEARGAQRVIAAIDGGAWGGPLQPVADTIAEDVGHTTWWTCGPDQENPFWPKLRPSSQTEPARVDRECPQCGEVADHRHTVRIAKAAVPR